ncbi:piggyBac transposable element-derived protein 2-like [Macrobrachium rosenbergii]|uniref:piggyBac transposable element-derived protein 2-like n=1 Tax=Macrobrachium rosenbergii TaxID=79674 RepID=UPI0034D4FD90
MITSKVSSTSPAEKLSIDEQIVPFKGTSSMKTYNPKKPKKWGYKIFVLSGTNGLVYNFKIYAGNISPVPGQPDLKASGNIVLDLLQPIPKGMWHKVYFDNWFNSPLLQTTLWKQGFGSLGTVRLNRVSGCNMPSDTQMKHLGRGTSVLQVTQMDDVELRVVKWYDNKGVTRLSNFAALEPQRTIQRWNSKEKIYVDIACPSIIMIYNKFMGGVDLLDSLLALYRIGLRSKKWYHKFLWHFLDVMLIQAWLLYIRDFDLSGAPKKDKLPLLKFKLEVSDCLLLKGKVPGPKRGRPSVSVDDLYRAKAKKGPTVKIPAKPIRTDMIGHFPEFAEKKGRCKYPGCTGICKVFCCKCRVNLCFTPKSNCFRKFHM